MQLDKGKIITIVQLGFSFLAFIFSIVVLAGGVTGNIDVTRSANWVVSQPTTGDFRLYRDLDVKDAVTAMGALSFLFTLANLVLVVAVKLFKPIKMLSMIGCGVCCLGIIFTLPASGYSPAMRM